MTHLFSVFKPARICRRDAVAGDIAAQCVNAVTQRLGASTTEMGVPELRGYVRARAFAVVSAFVEQAVDEERVPSANEIALIATVLERTVHIIVRDLQSPPVITVPSPHVRLRVAA